MMRTRPRWPHQRQRARCISRSARRRMRPRRGQSARRLDRAPDRTAPAHQARTRQRAHARRTTASSLRPRHCARLAPSRRHIVAAERRARVPSTAPPRHCAHPHARDDVPSRPSVTRSPASTARPRRCAARARTCAHIIAGEQGSAGARGVGCGGGAGGVRCASEWRRRGRHGGGSCNASLADTDEDAVGGHEHPTGTYTASSTQPVVNSPARPRYPGLLIGARSAVNAARTSTRHAEAPPRRIRPGRRRERDRPGVLVGRHDAQMPSRNAVMHTAARPDRWVGPHRSIPAARAAAPPSIIPSIMSLIIREVCDGERHRPPHLHRRLVTLGV